MKVTVIMLFLCLGSLNSYSQSYKLVNLDSLNPEYKMLFIGFNHTIAIRYDLVDSMPTDQYYELGIRSKECSVSFIKEDGLDIIYSIKTKNLFSVVIEVYRKGDLKVIEEITFKTDIAPEEITQFGSLISYDKVELADLLIQDEIIVTLPSSNLKKLFEVSRFRIKAKHKEKLIFDTPISGSTVDTYMKNEISKLPSGSTLEFYDIIAHGKNGTARKLSPISLFIK